MTKKEIQLLKRCLPKWPKMYVTGKDIQPDQALEIIRRTDSFFSNFSGNNRTFNEAAKRILSLPDICSYRDYSLYDEAKTTWDKKWELLDCYYIQNNWISSSFFYGANGWCHPNGKIGFGTNIGKYPCSKEVYDEWTIIATTFPFLELGITLYDGEWCDEDIKPVISFKIKNGKINIVDPLEENVHENQNYESPEDYLDSINIPYYKDKETNEIINYTEENAIPLEIIEDWGNKIIKSA